MMRSSLRFEAFPSKFPDKIFYIILYYINFFSGFCLMAFVLLIIQLFFVGDVILLYLGFST